jgi:hypothetical protein
MNSNDIVAIGENMMQHHVLEVVLDERSLLVRGKDDMITKGDGILR